MSTKQKKKEQKGRKNKKKRKKNQKKSKQKRCNLYIHQVQKNKYAKTTQQCDTKRKSIVRDFTRERQEHKKKTNAWQNETQSQQRTRRST